MINEKDIDTINDALCALAPYLDSRSTTPRLDIELLLAFILDKPRSYLYTYPDARLNSELRRRLLALIERRVQGEPLAYITGCKEFWSIELNVTPDTLIPRPETEHIIEWTLTHLPQQTISIADLGTGSGAIAIALAHERPTWKVHATDVSAAALRIAIQNAQRHKLTNIEFYLGSWCEALPHKEYHVIISNPPYIADDDPHLLSLTFEPRQALRAAQQGLAAINTIITQASTHLVPGGTLILEHGYNQALTVQELLTKAGFKDIESHSDLNNHSRFTLGHH